MSAQSDIRLRFAPSPTGYLHVGGARTALFCWLYARHCEGTFILRIEDTDLERSTPESIRAILDGMAWLGLDYDEGPYYQTKRFDRYREVIDQLLADGNAYRCFCSKERLAALREEQQQKKIKPRYDHHCRDLNLVHDESQPYVIRFRNPLDGVVAFEDLVRGPIEIQNQELDDLIIARSDGTPTYNFTVVVDDADMNISHVIRGDDHINNTPRQINILEALGAQIPQYGHVPMILGSDGKRLSKRHGAVSVLQFKDDGYLSQAMRNYLVRLGWSAGDQEIFSDEEMIRLFSLNAISRSPAAFDYDKLDWLNQHYLKTTDPNELAPLLVAAFHAFELDVADGPAVEAVIQLQAERVKTLKEMAEKSRYFYVDELQYDEKARQKHLKPAIAEALQAVRSKFSALSSWDADALHQIIIKTAEEFELKLGKLAQPIRVAVTGGTVSPPIDATLALIGRERVLARLDQVLHELRNNVGDL